MTRVLLVSALVLLLQSPSPVPAAGQPPRTVLLVEGRSNQTPWVAASGNFVAVVWGAQPEGGGADVFVAISRNGGDTFGTPVQVNATDGEARLGGELPPRVALRPRAGAEPDVVVAYGARSPSGTAIVLAQSSDGGRSFAPARALQSTGAPGDRGWHALAIDGEGTAHVMWLDHRGLAASRSHDHARDEAEALDGVAQAQRSSLYYARLSGDAASTVSSVTADVPANERALVPGVCYCCKVALLTGARGQLFAAWRHVYPGNIRDIAFLASTDAGRTFGTPGRVSDDGWHLAGCPDDGPAMDREGEDGEDGAGIVHVVWPTVIGGDTPEGAIFYAASHDEGRTFTPRVRVPTLGGPRPMHPQVLAGTDGRLTIAWDEVVDGTRRAAVQTMRVLGNGTPVFDNVHRLGTADLPTSYPVLASTSRGTLAVYVEGQPGRTLIRASRLDLSR